MKDLWVQADIDGNGVLDFSEFQVIKHHISYCVKLHVLGMMDLMVFPKNKNLI